MQLRRAVNVLTLGFVGAVGVAGVSEKPAAAAELVPVVGRAERFGVTAPVLKLPAAPVREVDPSKDPRVIRNPALGRIRKPPIRRPAAVPGSPDAALYAPAAPNAMSAPLLTFEGIANADNGPLSGGYVYPPDPNGDVGPNHYLQVVNLAVRVFDRTGAALTPPFLMSSLFASLGGACALGDDGDPIALYDHLADRWLLSQFSLPNGDYPPFHQCIAISQTGDPTGAYYVWDYVMPGSNLNDYPHFGVWPDAYYMTDNQFLSPALSFNGTGAFAFDRARLLAGDPAASFVYFDVATLDVSLGGMLPADLDGPARLRPNLFVAFTAAEFSDPQGDGLRLFEFTPDFTTPAASTFVELPALPVAAFDPISKIDRSDVPQPGTSAGLDAISDRLMHRLQYRTFGSHESLVVAHTVDASGDASAAVFRAGIRYYELRRALPSGSWTVHEQATYAPADGVHRWLGSAAMDGNGNLAVGFSVSDGTSTYPGIRYAGRLATDPPGGLVQGESVLQAGSGSQTGSAYRWGDYSMLAVDPTDDCTFWYTNEYYTATCVNCWQTRVGTFKFPACLPPGPSGTLTGTVTDSVSSAPLAGVTVTATGGYVAITDGSGVYSRRLPVGTYAVTASLSGHTSSTVTGVVVTSGGTTTADLTLTPAPIIGFVSRAVDDSAGNATGTVDRDECVGLGVTLGNTGASAATGIAATLATTTPGVTVVVATSTWADIAVGGSGASATPFRFQTTPAFVPGTTIDFALDLTTDQGPYSILFTVPSGTPSSAPTLFSATGPVSIPDNNAAGADLTIPVAGVTTISKLRVAARITHTWDSDLSLSLRGPDGTTVQLSTKRGSSGDGYGTDCPTDDGDDTVFDDAAATAISAGTAPFVGAFRPEQPLSVFQGKTGPAANGTWTLHVVDAAAGDVGAIQCVTLMVDGFLSASGGGSCRTLSVGDATVTEGDAGATNASFTVALTPAATGTVTVDFATADVTAAAGSDYTPTAGTLTFLAGEASKIVLVPVAGDTVDEDDETFTVSLSGASGVPVVDGLGAGTIWDDDAPPTIGISDVTQAEGTGGTTPFVFDVTLSAPSGKTVTVDAATADGTATAPGDYASRSLALTFPPGTTSVPLAVDIVGDIVDEANETFVVDLTAAVSATIADGQGVGTMGDDDVNFYSVTPCRVADTRLTDPPPLAAGASRDFAVAGKCGIPADASAVAFNVTVTQPATLGHIRLYPAGQAIPQASTLNFGLGQTRANNAIVPLGAGGQIGVYCGMASGVAHFILDVTGYFK